MSNDPIHRNSHPPRNHPPINVSGRDSFWSERHGGPVQGMRQARKKWQCLACGECGFAEVVHGEPVLEAAKRVGHRCQPESIVFYTPGVSEPLRE